MRSAVVTAEGDRIRWAELPSRVSTPRKRRGFAVLTVPDCGHDIMLDNPDGFARATATARAAPDTS
ncbi:hypothetical protein [Streptomyces antarcticus]|uniref:hypothetical protein n=1 Tax=Streptomyces antarcticus TaxID=2996458 RepID=UPI003B634D81